MCVSIAFCKIKYRGLYSQKKFAVHRSQNYNYLVVNHNNNNYFLFNKPV